MMPAAPLGGGPPLPPPPGAPTLSALPPPGAGPEGGPGPGQAGALPALVFAAVQALRDVARAAPDASEELDGLISDLRGILSKVLQGGAGRPNSRTPSVGEEGGPY